MWPFKKKKVLDLTKLKAKLETPTNNNDYKDFSYPQSAQTDNSGLGFLGNLATSSASSSNPSSLSGDLNIQHLKVKIEDIEYKLDNLTRKLSSILDRIDLLEKKMNKFERRGE